MEKIIKTTQSKKCILSLLFSLFFGLLFYSCNQQNGETPIKAEVIIFFNQKPTLSEIEQLNKYFKGAFSSDTQADSSSIIMPSGESKFMYRVPTPLPPKGPGAPDEVRINIVRNIPAALLKKMDDFQVVNTYPIVKPK